MDFGSLYQRFQTVKTNEVLHQMELRLVLGYLIKRIDNETVDFSCVICINAALKKIRKLSVLDFQELLTKKLMKNSNPFVLKGVGEKARQIKFRGKSYTNDNLTKPVAIDWLQHNEKGLINFVFSPELAREVDSLNLQEATVDFWLTSNAKTRDDFTAALATKKEEKTEKVSTDKTSNKKFKTTTLLADQKPKQESPLVDSQKDKKPETV